MNRRRAEPGEFESMRNFYWDLIDNMTAGGNNIGWKKGIYPTYEYLKDSLKAGELYVLVPHALAVSPPSQGRGIGKTVVRDIIELARTAGKKAVRLDILGGNTAAEKLYTSMGFKYVQAKDMYYEDTGLTEYVMYELNL